MTTTYSKETLALVDKQLSKGSIDMKPIMVSIFESDTTLSKVDVADGEIPFLQQLANKVRPNNRLRRYATRNVTDSRGMGVRYYYEYNNTILSTLCRYGKLDKDGLLEMADKAKLFLLTHFDIDLSGITDKQKEILLSIK